jgi:hypothetical protein
MSEVIKTPQSNGEMKTEEKHKAKKAHAVSISKLRKKKQGKSAAAKLYPEHVKE